MKISTALSLRSSQHRVCRIVRNPVVLLSIALVYLLAVLVWPPDEDARGLMALRGTTLSDSVDDDRARKADEGWEPESRLSYGDTARGPVKGGVEIYPVQVRSCLLLVLYVAC